MFKRIFLLILAIVILFIAALYGYMFITAWM